MSYPRPPGGLFPLTTRPTGNNAGGLYPLPAVLSDAIRSLAPTAYWKLDEASGNLADAMSGGYTATVTGSPTYGVAAPSPIGRGVTFSGTGQYATTDGAVPTPAASMSALVIFATANTTAAARFLFARRGSSQNSWHTPLSSSHTSQFVVTTSGGTQVAAATVSGAANDGLPHLVLGTFDGTTITCARDAIAVSSNTSVSGTWYRASTAGLNIAHNATANLFPGTLYVAAYWNDRVVSDAERLWLYSIMAGG